MAERKRKSFDRAQDDPSTGSGRSFDKLRMSGEGTGTKAPRIIANKNRRIQIAPTSRKLFDDDAKAEFLEWFAATANCSLAARKAGFHYRTVIRHWREDPAFGALCEEALAMGYTRLEELALRAAVEALKPAAGEPIAGDRPPPEEHFRMDPSTALQLLRDHWRHLAGLTGGSGRGAKPGPPGRRWTFEEAILELDKKLRFFGVRRGVTPPDEEADEADEADGAAGAGPEPADG